MYKGYLVILLPFFCFMPAISWQEVMKASLIRKLLLLFSLDSS